MSDNKDESENFCPSCKKHITDEDIECPSCGFGLRTQRLPLEIGDVLEGRYRIEAVVGKGGAGVVYKGTDLTLSREIAVKALLEQAADPVTLARFLHEARNLASVEHRGLVPVYAVGQESGAHYMVMKYIDGSTLAELIKQQGALPEQTVRQILIEACDALTALHTAGLIHRDLKPANLMIGKNGRVSVVDLGIVQRVTERHEASGQGAGTPKYMAPEMFSDADVTPKTDIYSLGIVGFHCLAGRPPFDGPTPMAILYKQAHEEPPRLNKLGLKISADMCATIHKAIAKTPSERFESAKAFSDALSGNSRHKNTSTSKWLILSLLIICLGTLAALLVPTLPTKVAEQPVLDAALPSQEAVARADATIPAEPEKVTVELRAGYPEAISIQLQDGSVVETPYAIAAEKGSTNQEVRAFAEGFEDKTISVEFVGNLQKAIVLKKARPKKPIQQRPSGFQLQPLEYED